MLENNILSHNNCTNQKMELIDNAINFIYKVLDEWKNYIYNNNDKPSKENENNLTLSLTRFLNTYTKIEHNYHFDREEPQTANTRIDISCYGNDMKTIVVIETKRLPAPTKNRKIEYVTGFDNKNGAMQRFKLGLHGSSYSKSAIIGYVQDKSNQYFFNEINKWIMELEESNEDTTVEWSKKDLINIKIEEITKSYYISNNPRNKLDNIELHHLLINLTN